MKSQFTEEKEDGACYVGQPVQVSPQEFVQALKDAVNKLIDERKEELLEADLDLGDCGTYFEGIDRDSVDVGVGCVTVREDVLQDEDKALEDAEEEIIEELVNNEDAVQYLFENNEFTTILGKFLKGC